MSRYLLLIAAISVSPLSAAGASADDTFTVGITLSAPLSSLARKINAELPPDYKKGPRREICVPAKRACTKIPEFRGLKIYSRMECIDVVPKISCDVTETAVREGSAVFTAIEGGFSLRQRIQASGTARGRGAIGKQIRQTVRGTAEVTVTAQPRIMADWSIEPGLAIKHSWPKRPNFKLFNLIPITVGSIVDAELNKAKAKLINQTIPQLAKEVNLQSQMARVWRKFQEPRKVRLSEGGTDLYVHLRPEKVAFSGVRSQPGVLQAAVRVQGRSAVSDRAEAPWAEKTALPQLTSLPDEPTGLSLSVPITVSWPTINQQLATMTYEDVPLGAFGKLEVKKLEMGGVDDADGNRITARIEARIIPASILPEFNKAFSLSALADLSANRRALVLRDIEVEGTGLTSDLAKALAAASGILQKAINIPLDEHLEKVQRALQDVLTGDFGAFNSSGSVTLGVDGLSSNAEVVTVNALVAGNLNLQATLGE